MGLRCFLPETADPAVLLALVPECTLLYGGPLALPMALVALVFFLPVARNRIRDANGAPLALARRDAIHRR